MAGGMYSAGKVGVDIVPDTSGFWALLHAELSSRHPEVTVDVNMRGIAQAEGALSRLDGRTLTNVVKIEGDDSGLRRIDRVMRQQRLLWEKRPITSKYDLDDTPFIGKITRLASTVKTGTERVNSFVKQSNKSVTETLRDDITSLRKTQSEYDRQVTEATRRRERLIRDEKAAYDMYAEAIEANRARIEQLAKSGEDANRTLEWSKRKMKELRAEGDTAGADWFKNTRIPELREQIKGFTAQIREAKKEIRDYKKEQDKLYSADFDNRVAEQTRKIEEGTRQWEESVDAIREYSSKLKDSKLIQDEFAKSTDRMTSMFRKSLDVQKQADKLVRQQAQSLPQLTEGQRLLAGVLGDVDGKYTDLDGAVSDSRRSMDQQRQTARNLTDVFDEQENAVRDLMQAFERFKPMGIDKLTGKQLNQTIKQLDALRDYASRHPIEAKLRMDKGDWDRSYTDVMYKAEKLRAKLEQDHEVDVRVKVWEDSADRLEQRLEKLRHTRVDIPVDWQVEQEGLIRAMRETAAKIKADPSRRWELEADLDVQMHKAEEKLKKFENEHDELKMDLDLETALARAHLAYFTRPRTVDIFANFKGTDLGKIFTGMTSGATGLKGVQNQFDNLVNTFDKLDKVVPKWSLLGAGLTALGAGLLNLGRTAGGVGVSLVSMTKAAMAAPGALIGIGAAFTVLKHAWGDKGETFSSQIDIASTKLSGLGDAMDEAFYGKARPAIRDLMDDVSGKLIPGITGIAEAEGSLVTGLADVIRKSYEADELPRIFDQSRIAIDNLNPGLQSLVKAFLGLGDQTSVYLPRMASYISNVADYWARWVDTASKTGQINTAMEKAIEQGGYLKSSVMDLGGVLTGLFRPLAEDQNGLEVFARNVHKANEAVNSVKFQETMTAWVDGATAAQQGMRNAFKDVGDAFYSLKDVTRSVFADAGQIVGSGITAISRVLQQSGSGIRDFSSGIRDGFTEAFKAIGDAGPMFSDLASMVGQLSRTFGGTFASTLKAAAPTIQLIASATNGIATAFNALPGPVKAVIGIWSTFGKAGVQAFNSLKTGMLQNIQQTMQYQKMLSELGLSAEQAGIKMGTLIKAMGQLRSGNYAGILSNAVRNVDELGDAAERNAQKVQHAADSSKEFESSSTIIASSSSRAEKAMKEMSDEAEKAPKRVSGLSKAVNGVVDAFGGWGNIAFMGISTGIALVGSAISDYTEKAEASKKATDTAISGLVSLKANSVEAGKAYSDYTSQIAKNWSDSATVFGSDAGGFWSKIGAQMQGGFTDAKSAADSLGISVKDLTSAVTGNEGEYNKLKKQLTATSKETYLASDAFGNMTTKFTPAAMAAQTLLEALDKQHANWGKVVDDVKKYMDSTDQLTDMSTNLSDSIDMMNSSVQANGVVFQQTGELIDQSNQAGQRTVHMFQDVASNALLAAQQMMIYGQKNGETEKYTQLATNAIYQAREAIIQQAIAAGMSQQAAEQYADSLGLIPSNVGTTITADTKPARDEVATLLSQISGLTDDQKQIILDLYDKGVLTSLGGVENMVTQLMGGKVSQRALTLLMNADGDAEWKTENVKSNLEALGMSPKTYEWLLNGNGTAEERMQKVKDSLSDLNLTDKQIQWILDCIDNASPKADKAKQDKADLANPISYTISVNDQTAAAFAAVQARAEVLEDGKTVVISGDDTDYLNKVAQVTGTQIDPKTGTLTLDKSQFDIAMALAAGAQIDPKTGLLKGDNSDMMQKVAEANGWKIDEKTGIIKGDNGQALQAITYVNNQKIADKDFVIKANDWATQVVAHLQQMQIGDKSFTITTYYNSVGEKVIGGTIPKSALATGGRVSGPGTGTSDSIHALLSNGEMVIRASSVKKLDAKYGKGFLDTLNNIGTAPMQPSPVALKYRVRSQAYAAGGRVAAMRDPAIQVTPVINTNVVGGSLGVKETQEAVASGVSAALKQAQMKLAFDARGTARVLAEPMSKEIGMLQKSGRMR